MRCRIGNTVDVRDIQVIHSTVRNQEMGQILLGVPVVDGDTVSVCCVE